MDERQCCLRLGGVVRVVYRSRLPGDARGGHVGLPACTATCGTSGITLAGVDRHPSGVHADRAATGISRRLLVILRRRSCLGVLFFNEAPGLQCRIRPCAGANRAIAWVSPLLVLLLGEASLLSMPANFLTVPIVTLVTVPTLFLGLGLAMLAFWLPALSAVQNLSELTLQVADFSLALVDVLLTALLESVPQHSVSVGYVGVWAAITGLVGGIAVLMPVSIHARIGLLCAIVPLGLQASENVYFGEVCVRVVDVGQGSAALIDTARHRLLVDTGPRFGFGDVGRSHILPILRLTGRHDLDLLLLSHTDLDHAGGMAFFRSYFDPVPVIGPDTCAHGHTWLWDGVRFTTLQAVGLISDNDRSCTLLIETERHTAYLSGDISARAEQALLAHLPSAIAFLLAPHPGSASSSSKPFVRQLAPEIVIYSAGKANRYGHPHPRVVQRYAWEGSRQLSTAEDGAIQWCSSRHASVRTERQKI